MLSQLMPRLQFDPSPMLRGDLDLNGRKVSAALAVEIDRLSGVVSPIQTQLNSKVSPATLVVAANDTTARGKASADYVCDGTDDQVQIQAAIDALPANGGDVLLLEGTYNVNKTADRAKWGGTAYGSIWITASKVRLRGVGYGSRLVLGNAQNCAVVHILGDNLYGVSVEDLYINGNHSNNSNSTGYQTDGVLSDPVTGTPLTYGPFGTTVKNCYIESCVDLCIMLKGPGSRALNNIVGHANSDCIEFLYANGAVASGNLVLITGQTGFSIGSDTSNFVRITNNTTFVFPTGRLTNGHRLWYNNYGSVVENNMIFVDPSAGGQVTRAVMLYGRQCIVRGNVFMQHLAAKNSASGGIYVATYSGNANGHNLIENNILYQGNVNIDESTTYGPTIVRGNVFYDFVAPKQSKVNYISGIAEIYDNISDVLTVVDMRLVPRKNTSGGTLAAGAVVIAGADGETYNGSQVTTTTTQGDDKVLGMNMVSAADDATCYIQTLGKTVLLKVDGTEDIAVGDLLGAGTAAGIAMKAAAGDMAFAQALEAYTGNDSNGVIDALLITPRKL